MGSWMFRTRDQGEVQARDINWGVINTDMAFKASSPNEISKGVSMERKEGSRTDPLIPGRGRGR